MEQADQGKVVQENKIPEDTGPSPQQQALADSGVNQGGAEESATPPDPAAEQGAHQPHHQYAQQPLPPGYAVDPRTGQIIYVGQPYQQPLYQQPIHPAMGAPGVVYVQAETPEQAAARQAMEQQRYGQIMQSFEQFMQGEATVSDVVKTLYTNTAQYDQLWKGALVGAAATLLLTSKPAREAMGKTFGSVFPGLKSPKKEAAATAAKVDPTKTGKE